MAQVSTPPGQEEHFGATARRDAWWLGPLLTFLGLLAFLIYATLIVLAVPGYFEIRRDKPGYFATGHDNVFFEKGNPVVAPYLAPFSSPLLYDSQSHHALFKQDVPGWWPSWFPFTSAMLILIFPAMFRFTCYYYRKAYYRSWWMDPPACAVGEPRKGYLGENHWPLLIQNSHRYWMYAAVVLLIILALDALRAFWWPTDRAGNLLAGGQFGVGLGTLLMLANVVLLAGFTFGCNSVRHLVGGRLNRFACFTCPHAGAPPVEQKRAGYYAWRFSTLFNDHHMLWAWLSLFSVGFTDLYIRLCAMGIWTDPRLI